jgi:hypothetical protein
MQNFLVFRHLRDGGDWSGLRLLLGVERGGNENKCEERDEGCTAFHGVLQI